MLEFVVAFLGVIILSFALIPLSNKIGLVDKPSSRKHHQGEVPLIGGLAMFVSCSLAAFFFVPYSSEMSFLLVACGLLVSMGSIDDKFNINYQIRLGVQAIAAAILVWAANTQLNSFGDIFSFGSVDLFWLSIPMTFFAVMGMINAFNMIDGIDGLSGGLALISCIGLYVLIGYHISDGASDILLLLIGALSAYLVLNLHLLPKLTSKVFMGDAGSMVLGFIVTAFLIRYSQGEKEIIMPVTALWIVAIPLSDIVVTILRRIRHKKNPLHPDRTHVHHVFLLAGFSERLTLIIILSLQFFAVVLGLIFERIHIEALSFFGFLIFFTCYSQFVKKAFSAAKI